ncbi:lazarillo protein [Aedes aegypti]|uniref:Apolipoprotein D n=1 Tax=Aedes aegypti TaxID=7159 RepID=A0A1S4FMM7_AEDAE|nr:lazarillo protein [Aedes aegypti]
MRSLLVFLATFTVFLSKTLSINVQGPCRDLPVENQFNITQYMGTWYEIKRYENEFQPNGDCVTAQYTLNTTNMEVTVENTMKKLPDQKPSVARGRAVLANPTSAEAKLLVRFESTPETVPSSIYWVLKTDYQKYAVVWSCHAAGENSTESAWILSRSPVMEQASELVVENLIKQHLKPESFRNTKQGDEFCSGATAAKISSVLLFLFVLLICKKY